jgi:GT2 family glycosyltransferase
MAEPDTQSSPPIHVVVAHWNDEETTTICLEHLRTISRPSIRVTVVDSGSTDGSGERIQDSQNWVRVIRIPENRGHAFAANVGASSSPEGGSPYLFFLDNDALSSLIACMCSLRALNLLPKPQWLVH